MPNWFGPFKLSTQSIINQIWIRFKYVSSLHLHWITSFVVPCPLISKIWPWSFVFQDSKPLTRALRLNLPFTCRSFDLFNILQKKRRKGYPLLSITYILVPTFESSGLGTHVFSSVLLFSSYPIRHVAMSTGRSAHGNISHIAQDSRVQSFLRDLPHISNSLNLVRLSIPCLCLWIESQFLPVIISNIRREQSCSLAVFYRSQYNSSPGVRIPRDCVRLNLAPGLFLRLENKKLEGLGKEGFQHQPRSFTHSGV